MRHEQSEAVKLSVGRWATRGYTAEDVGLIHGISENTVRRQGVASFGSKRIWGRWRKALTAKPEVPENLLGFRRRILNYFQTGKGPSIEHLKIVFGDFNEHRVQDWIDLELAKIAAGNQLRAWACQIDGRQ